jgi:hypothetical protein
VVQGIEEHRGRANGHWVSSNMKRLWVLGFWGSEVLGF